MEPYRFSPVKSTERLLEAITYTHFACFGLCKKVYGEYLPAAGNIGIFSHYDDEFARLKGFREQLTDASEHWNGKYFRLHEPITIDAGGGIPRTVYTHLYVRKPDPAKPHVGDVDFVMDRREYAGLKSSLKYEAVRGMTVLDRPDLDLIKLSDPGFDVLSFIGRKTMAQNLAVGLDDSDSLALCRPYLGKRVWMVCDRPLGTKHPRHGYAYEVNYGYVPGVKAPDGGDLDAYYLGTDKPLERAEGICIAIIHRRDDDDDKLVVVTPGTIMTDAQILAAVHFQERWFDSVVVRS